MFQMNELLDRQYWSADDGANMPGYEKAYVLSDNIGGEYAVPCMPGTTDDAYTLLQSHQVYAVAHTGYEIPVAASDYAAFQDFSAVTRYESVDGGYQDPDGAPGKYTVFNTMEVPGIYDNGNWGTTTEDDA
jgi:hypothetical protein